MWLDHGGSDDSSVYQIAIRCDSCGKETEYSSRPGTLCRQLKKAGWRLLNVLDVAWFDLCPVCAQRIENAIERLTASVSVSLEPLGGERRDS